MKIIIDSESLIESTRSILSCLYSKQLDTGISAAEALLAKVTKETLFQENDLKNDPSDHVSDRRRTIYCKDCPAFFLEEVGLVKFSRASANLFKETATEIQRRDDCEVVDFLYRQKEYEKYKQERELEKKGKELDSGRSLGLDLYQK